jgi:hypothetical protein
MGLTGQAFGRRSSQRTACSRRTAVARGITASGAAPLEPTEEVLAEVAEAEVRRSALAETVWLLGDVGTNTAAVRLNHCLWHLEWPARELPPPGRAAGTTPTRSSGRHATGSSGWPAPASACGAPA